MKGMMKNGAWCMPVAVIVHSIILGVFIIGAALILNSGSDGTQVAGTVAVVDDADSGQDDSGLAPTTPPPAVDSNDHIYGNVDADIFLVEYSDLECPYCQSFHPTAKQAVDEYGGQVAWVYRHYPLPFHPNAKPAAQASECVAELKGNDAFWGYIDTLFEQQSTALARDNLVQHATQLGIRESNFVECLDSDRYASVVEEDLAQGLQAGVGGTPYTFVVSRDDNKVHGVINGAQSLEVVRSTIDAALNS